MTLRLFIKTLMNIWILLFPLASIGQVNVAEISALLQGKEVVPVVKIGYSGKFDPSNSSMPVNTYIYPDGHNVFKVDVGPMHTAVSEWQVFNEDTKFTIAGIEAKKDNLALTIIVSNNPSIKRIIRVMFDSGWQTSLSTQVVKERIDAILTDPHTYANAHPVPLGAPVSPTLSEGRSSPAISPSESGSPAPDLDVSNFEIAGVRPGMTLAEMRSSLRPDLKAVLNEGCLPHRGEFHLTEETCSQLWADTYNLYAGKGDYAFTITVIRVPTSDNSEKYLVKRVEVQFAFGTTPTQEQVTAFIKAAEDKYGSPSRVVADKPKDIEIQRGLDSTYLPNVSYGWCANKTQETKGSLCDMTKLNLLLSIPEEPSDYGSHPLNIYLQLDDMKHVDEYLHYEQQEKRRVTPPPL